jgi:RP/EB family microtubule-associated protein
LRCPESCPLISNATLPNFNAFSHVVEHEFLPNYKILQNVFTQEGVNKHIDVPRLVKARVQDNLEFLQWVKAFFDSRYQGPYDAVQRRKEARIKPSAAAAPPAPGAAGAPRAARVSPSKASLPSATAAAAAAAAGGSPSASAAGRSRTGASPGAGPAARAGRTAGAPAGAVAGAGAGNAAGPVPALARVQARLAELKASIPALEQERNNYFNLLREVEIACQEDEAAAAAAGPASADDGGFRARVLDVLYKTDDADEFRPPGDEGDDGEDTAAAAAAADSSAGADADAEDDAATGQHAHSEADAHANADADAEAGAFGGAAGLDDSLAAAGDHNGDDHDDDVHHDSAVYAAAPAEDEVADEAETAIVGATIDQRVADLDREPGAGDATVDEELPSRGAAGVGAAAAPGNAEFEEY